MIATEAPENAAYENEFECEDAEFERVLARAQSGESAPIEAILAQFEPLIRAQSRRLWTELQSRLSSVEWSDVYSQVRLSFLTRLRDFQPERGVYFSFYVRRMLDLDGRAWLRSQQRCETPWSQIGTQNGNDSDEIEYSISGENPRGRASIEDALGENSLGENLSNEDALSENSLGEDALQAENSSANDAMARLDDAVSLRAALATLSAAQREAVWRCCVLAQTENEVAAALKISRSAVRNRLAGALAKLRAFFRDSELFADANADEKLANLAARTGRAAPRELELQRAFWLGRNEMAKDEKRPDLVGVGVGRPILLQGVFEFPATGLRKPQLLSSKLSYSVPPHCVVGIRYLRIGVQCESLVCVSTMVNGDVHRLIPVAANSTIHVPLAIVEPIIAGSQIEIHIASDSPGIAIVDVGCLQMPA